MRNLVKMAATTIRTASRSSTSREAVGYAVRANYLYAGAADLLLETGDEKLRARWAIWKNVTEQKMYVTGGCALYAGASPDGSEINRESRASGIRLRLPTA
jgi:DUF1680 family protein